MQTPSLAYWRKMLFIWYEATAEAFTLLKQIMTTSPVLALPYFHKPFLIKTDASCMGEVMGMRVVMMKD